MFDRLRRVWSSVDRGVKHARTAWSLIFEQGAIDKYLLEMIAMRDGGVRAFLVQRRIWVLCETFARESSCLCVAAVQWDVNDPDAPCTDIEARDDDDRRVAVALLRDYAHRIENGPMSLRPSHHGAIQAFFMGCHLHEGAAVLVWDRHRPERAEHVAFMGAREHAARALRALARDLAGDAEPDAASSAPN
jgi:hypothetical protein